MDRIQKVRRIGKDSQLKVVGQQCPESDALEHDLT